MKTIYIIAGVILALGLIVYFAFKRNYFNKHKYIRLVTYHDDMTITVEYIKKVDFSETKKEIKINPTHVFDFRGYKTIILTDKSCESINPLDFESKFSAKDYKSGMRSKLVKDAFDSVKTNKFDLVHFSLIINILSLLAIAYLLYVTLGGAK